MTPLSGTDIPLRFGDYTAHIATVGATLRALEHRRRPLVHSFAADGVRPQFLGATLVPWPNRVVDGRYRFAGTDQVLALTEPERGHALHGLAVWLDFQVVESDEASVTLTATVPAQRGYPHRIAVTVTYRLDECGLTCTTTGENTGPTAAPYGQSAHPYLVAGVGRPDEWTLTIPAAVHVETDDRLAPTGVAPVAGHTDFRTPRAIGTTRLDTAFGDLIRDATGTATVRIEAADGAAVSLSWGPEYPWLQVFTGDLPEPELARRSVAVEPMTCAPDAFNTGAGLIVLEPGDSFTGNWRLSAE
ncbi:MAG: Aldose 1-epimerase [Naasia sp.]|nr:Aldose 1-epimerase [Naasia sp.]